MIKSTVIVCGNSFNNAAESRFSNVDSQLISVLHGFFYEIKYKFHNFFFGSIDVPLYS